MRRINENTFRRARLGTVSWVEIHCTFRYTESPEHVMCQ